MSTIPWSVILDPQRLNDLKSLNIIDTEAEQSYDDLAEVARLICGAPVANVVLVAEDRQWFKSYIGNDIQETPIAQSICAHALNASRVLVINDLTEDARTRANILVTGEAALRFYAGVPLRLGSGFGVGTLCVVDTKPRPTGLMPVQVKALEALGRQATILLQVRKYLAAKESCEEDFVTIGEPLEEISEALLTAYELNKNHQDSVLETLISSSLTHIALRIANSGLGNSLYLH